LTNEKKYPWYEILNKGVEDIQQGDIIINCEIYETVHRKPDNAKESPIKTITNFYDVVVMSQSCDIYQNKIDLILVCPLFTYSYLKDKDNTLSSLKKLDEVKKGERPNYHLLNCINIKTPEYFIKFMEEYLIVDFHNVFSVPINYLREYCLNNPRIRILPPYRDIYPNLLHDISCGWVYL
jgi:hypothetical protein